MKKSQSSIEFTIVLSIVLLGFSLFLIFYNVEMVNVQKDLNHNLLVDAGQVIESEIGIAAHVEKGYKRSFYLPNQLNRLDYNVSFVNGSSMGTNYTLFMINFKNEDKSNGYVFFTYPNISGKIILGTNNNITKKDQMICMNECT